MDAEEPLVSVVVVTLNRKDLLGRCLESLAGQDYGNVDVIVVDNGSTEDIEGFVTGEFPKVRYLRLAENLGFAGGNNRGIDMAGGRYVALLNNDAVADPGWIRAMVEPAERDSRLGAVASVVIDGNRPSVLDSCGVGIALDGMSRQVMRGAPVPDAPLPGEVLAVSGCACMFRAAALRETGLFDEAFFAYCEDTDLCLRLQRAGWDIAIAPNARATHYYSATSGAFSLRKIFWVERNHYWVALKSFPVRLLVLLPIVTVWRFLVQARAIAGNGELSGFLSESGFVRVVMTLLRAHMSAMLGTPRILLWRLKGGRPARRGGEMARRLLRHRLSIREVVGVR